MKKFWKDYWNWWTYFVKFVLLSPVVLILITINKWDLFITTNLSNKIAFVIIMAISSFGFLALITHKLSAITSKGILLGTVSRDDHIENPKLSIRKFFPWKEIKQINVYKKKCRRSFGITDFVSTLQIITNGGKKYECYINDIFGFYASLKSINKSLLVAKGSYSGPSTTEIPVKKLFSQNTQYVEIIYRVIFWILLIILIKVILSKLLG